MEAAADPGTRAAARASAIKIAPRRLRVEVARMVGYLRLDEDASISRHHVRPALTQSPRHPRDRAPTSENSLGYGPGRALVGSGSRGRRHRSRRWRDRSHGWVMW